MIAATIQSWNNPQSGTAKDGLGREYLLNFIDAQSFMYGTDLATPQLNSKHDQPHGYGLKHPEVGDAILLVQEVAGKQAWGYMRHYLDLLERTRQ